MMFTSPYTLWLAIILGIVVVSSLIFMLIDGWRHVLPVIVVIAALAALGATAGMIGGLSRVAVAGQIVPAALSILGGITAYLFFADQSKGTIVSVSVLAFVSSLFVAYVAAADMRRGSDMIGYWRQACVDIYSNPDTKISSPAVNLNFGMICGWVFRYEHESLGLMHPASNDRRS